MRSRRLAKMSLRAKAASALFLTASASAASVTLCGTSICDSAGKGTKDYELGARPIERQRLGQGVRT